MSGAVTAFAVHATPVGPLALAVDGDGRLALSAFLPAPTDTAVLAGLVARRLARLGTSPAAARAASGALPEPRDDLGGWSAAARDWAAGDVTAWDRAAAELGAEQFGTGTQRAVWDALRAVPPGAPVSYAALGAAAGLPPGAVRAVGGACGANLLAPLVPCHRAVRSDGSLGGYAYGLPVKRALLAWEADVAGTTLLWAPVSR